MAGDNDLINYFDHIKSTKIASSLPGEADVWKGGQV